MPTAIEIPLGTWAEVLSVADQAGDAVALFDGPLDGPDAWTLATALASARSHLHVLVVLDADRRPPGMVAMMAATLDALSEGRLALGLRQGETDGDGTRLAEVHEIVDRLLMGETLDYTGTHHHTAGAVVGLRPVQAPRPPLLLDAGDGRWVEDHHEWFSGPLHAPQ